ncbi:MAG: glycosyltransferase family 2 protein [Muribaculaceae bacterium]|nr:glycosyltransferase family 2 protein [Muribaculaceae bacterium]
MTSHTTGSAEGSDCRAQPVVALVVPCYNEEASLPIALPVLCSILDGMAESGAVSASSYILCVDDGSNDATWHVIEHMHRRDGRVKGLRLAHNSGQQSALYAGLMCVGGRCDAAVTVDADLQDSPEAIADMVERYREGFDIVYGVRSSRQTDTWFKRNSAHAFYRLQHLLGMDTVYDHSEFRLMSALAIGMLADYPEHNLYIRGIMPHIGLSSTTVSYDRAARTAGESKYSLGKLLSTSVDGITSFSAKPMRMIFFTGALLLVLDIAVAVWVLVSYLCGRAIFGWSSMMLSLWLLTSLVLMAIGVVGEYVGKIFNEVKRRPRYAVAETLF